MLIKITKLITFLIILFIILVFFISLNKISIYDTKNLAGSKLTKIRVENFYKEQEMITEEDFKDNNFTLINFWASWCAPCRDEHKYLLRLNKEKNLTLIGVNFKDKKDNALKFLKDLGNPYDKLGLDKLGKNSVDLGIYGIPESLLVNQDLIIIKKFVGPLSKTDHNYIKEMIFENEKN